MSVYDTPYNFSINQGPPTTLIDGRGWSKLGWGIQGFIPQALVTTDTSNCPVDTRFILRNAWNTTYPTELRNTQFSKPAQTPFRVVNNSGDILSRQYYSCGGPCQTPQFRPQNHGLKPHFGHISDNCDGTGVPPSSCNTKYVYDSSDYTRYRKQRANLKAYNLLTNGNDSSSTSQSQYRASHHY